MSVEILLIIKLFKMGIFHIQQSDIRDGFIRVLCCFVAHIHCDRLSIFEGLKFIL